MSRTKSTLSSPAAASAGTASGQAAPASIQAARAAICASLRAAPTGMRGKPPSPRTRFMSRLSAAFPGSIAFPDTPPLSSASRESSRRSACTTAPEWQARHDVSRIGKTSFRKSTVAAVRAKAAFEVWAARSRRGKEALFFMELREFTPARPDS